MQEVEINLNFLYSILFIGFIEVVSLLINRGANVNAVNGDSNSVLMLASSNGMIANNAEIQHKYLIMKSNNEIEFIHLTTHRT